MGPMDPESPGLLILFGSETGVAEEISERVGREAWSKYGVMPEVVSMDSYFASPLHHLPTETRPTLFICSTTGQGDEPKNMVAFWKFLCRRSHPVGSSGLLSALRFTVFALGDSSYTKFNWVGKKLYKRLSQLGAHSMLEMGLGDDQHDLGPDGELDPWLARFWGVLGWNANGATASTTTGIPASKFLLLKAEVSEVLKESLVPDTCILKSNQRVTAEDHFQDVRLISIEFPVTTKIEPSPLFSPGDVLIVQPSNLIENVNLFFELFPQFSSDTTRHQTYYNIKPNPLAPWAAKSEETLGNSNPGPFPRKPWNLNTMVQHYFDLQSIPKRYFFELLSYFTTNELEREKLLEFSSPGGQEDLWNYCHRPKRNVLEVLQDFPHARSNIVKLDHLFDLIGPIRPRSFSIASPPPPKDSELQIIQLLVAVVNYKTKLKKERIGLCSNWLARLNPGDKIPAWIGAGSFQFPLPSENVPIIMVGPGTGIAPFRSLILNRINNPAKPDLTLFFGCRFQQKDYYFKDEWESLRQNKQLRFFPAFSRDNPDGNKQYVQHKILEESELVWELIENQGGIIFVAGNAKRMPIDVAEAFTTVFKEFDCPHPENYMKHLIKSGRYQTEVW